MIREKQARIEDLQLLVSQLVEGRPVFEDLRERVAECLAADPSVARGRVDELYSELEKSSGKEVRETVATIAGLGRPSPAKVEETVATPDPIPLDARVEPPQPPEIPF